MNESPIEWTDYTSNPLKYRHKLTGLVVWACVKESPACLHCYAESLAKRYGRGTDFTQREMAMLEPFMDRGELTALAVKAKPGCKVFVGDMTDIFGPWVDYDLTRALFGQMARRPDVIYQVLTKHPDRMLDFIRTTTPEQIYLESQDIVHDGINHFDGEWPLPNVWLGTTVEDQPNANKRIPYLLQCGAKVLWLSIEPQLGPIDLHTVHYAEHALDVLTRRYRPWETRQLEHDVYMSFGLARLGSIRWAVVGGESGAGARPTHPDWPRSLRDQCQAAGVPFFFKQWGEWVAEDQAPSDVVLPSTSYTPWSGPLDAKTQEWTGDQTAVWRVGKHRAGRLLDGKLWSEYPS